MVHEVDAGRRGLVPQDESGMRSVRGCAVRPAIQSNGEADGREERNRDDGAPKRRVENHMGQYSAFGSFPDSTMVISPTASIEIPDW